MAKGVNDAGYEANFKTIFRASLGEAYDELVDASKKMRGCSSIAYRGDNNIFLAHNEEDKWRYPLCYARVHLRKKGCVKNFLSVSYPFQFFGSVADANFNLAFTGNTIWMNGSPSADLPFAR